MKAMVLTFITVFSALNCFAQSPEDLVLVAAERFEKVDSHPAEVIIKGGQVTKSNCDEYTANNQDGITYTLKQEKNGYVCQLQYSG
ncbi:MAG: hypothetical protein M9899_00015 [Bdellovibrionaceae bacterium]|nr:hypothetical protein [Pseudobdellovibrionaceae bacterium]